MANKVLSFDEFDKKAPLQDPKNALTGDNVDSKTKETFVNQIKHADLTQLDVNEPDYSKITKIDEADNSEIANLQSTVTAAQRELNEFKERFYAELAAKEKDLQTKVESLNQAIANAAVTQTTTLAPTTNTPTAQQSIGNVAPGQTPAQPAIV